MAPEFTQKIILEELFNDSSHIYKEANSHGKYTITPIFADMKYATLAVSILIIIAVLIPGRNLPDVSIGGYDKLVHMGMFLMWALAVQYDFGARRLSRLVIILLSGIAFSALTEVVQIMVEGRSFDIYDMIADIVGLLAGLLIGRPIIEWLRELIHRAGAR